MGNFHNARRRSHNSVSRAWTPEDPVDKFHEVIKKCNHKQIQWFLSCYTDKHSLLNTYGKYEETAFDLALNNIVVHHWNKDSWDIMALLLQLGAESFSKNAIDMIFTLLNEQDRLRTVYHVAINTNSYSIKGQLLYVSAIHDWCTCCRAVLQVGLNPSAFWDSRFDMRECYSNQMGVEPFVAQGIVGPETVLLFVKTAFSHRMVQNIVTMIIRNLELYIERNRTVLHQVITLLSLMGYTFSEEDCELLGTEFSTEMQGMKRYRRCAPSLQHLSRLRIRQNFNCNMLYGLCSTNLLPNTLKHYVMFELD